MSSVLNHKLENLHYQKMISLLWLQLVTTAVIVNSFSHLLLRPCGTRLVLNSNKSGGSGRDNDRKIPRFNTRTSSNDDVGSSLRNVRKSATSLTRNDGIRQARISRSIRDELSEIICEGDIKATAYPEDDLLKSTCITDVDISPDLAYAKIYISVIGNSVQRRQVYVWLCENTGQVRFELAKRLKHMKRLPDLIFKLSDNKESSDLLSLIDQVTEMESDNKNDIDDDDEEYEVFEE